MNARLMGVKPTGNGRRESYAHLPMPRMTNTYMLGGDKEPAEIIASIKKGPVRHQLRRRPGGHHQRQVRVQCQPGLVGGKRQDPVPGEGRHLVGSGPESLKKSA
jgi:TldD protein